MVSRISGPIPPHPCYEKLDSQSQTYLKVPATRTQHDAEQTTTTQRQESLCLALEVEGHAMPSTYKHTSLYTLRLCCCLVLLNMHCLLSYNILFSHFSHFHTFHFTLAVFLAKIDPHFCSVSTEVNSVKEFWATVFPFLHEASLCLSLLFLYNC